MNLFRTLFVMLCFLLTGVSLAQSALESTASTVENAQTTLLSEQLDALRDNYDLHPYCQAWPIGILKFDSYSVYMSNLPTGQLEYVFFQV